MDDAGPVSVKKEYFYLVELLRFELAVVRVDEPGRLSAAGSPRGRSITAIMGGTAPGNRS